MGSGKFNYRSKQQEVFRQFETNLVYYGEKKAAAQITSASA